MSVNLASRISALLLAGTIVVASWSPVLATPSAAIVQAPVVAIR